MTVAVLGEALIDFIADQSGAYRAYLGGSPFNVAIGLARQGIETRYLSPLSNDLFGQQLTDALRAEGVVLPLMRRSPWPTSLALVALDAEGQASYRFYREGVADKDTTAREIEIGISDGIAVLHTGSLAITPSQVPKIMRLMQFAKSRGILVSIDINIRLLASIDKEKYLRGVRSLLPYADMVKASDEDLTALELHRDLDVSVQQACNEIGEGVLILTKGDKGAEVYTAAGQIARAQPPDLESVVDTVGAGDSFYAAFLAYLLHEQLLNSWIRLEGQSTDLCKALEYACAAAAINVSRVGCSPPTATEVLEFMQCGGIPSRDQ